MLEQNIYTFINVVETGSFSAASEKMLLSKVSIMNQINALENVLKVNLFNRTNRGVSLTSAGQEFYSRAKQLVKEVDQIVSDIREIEEENRNVINIGVSLMRPCNELIELWENFKVKVDYKFNIIPFNDDIAGLEKMLQSLGHEIDCFLTPCSSQKILDNYNFLKLRDSDCKLAMSRNHKLAKKDIIELNDLKNESILLVSEGNSYVIDKMREDLNLKFPEINIEDFNGYYDISTFNKCENNNYLMETLDIWSSVHPLLKTSSVNWNYKMPYGIVYSKRSDKNIEEFISIIKDNISFID